MSINEFFEQLVSLKQSSGWEIFDMFAVIATGVGAIWALISFLRKALYLGGQTTDNTKLKSLSYGFLIVILFGVSIMVLLYGLLQNENALAVTALSLAACYSTILAVFIFFAALKIWSSRADLLDFALICAVTIITAIYSIMLLKIGGVQFEFGTRAVSMTSVLVLVLAAEKTLSPTTNNLGRFFQKASDRAFKSSLPEYAKYDDENFGEKAESETSSSTQWRKFTTVGEVVFLLIAYFLLCGGLSVLFMATNGVT